MSGGVGDLLFLCILMLNLLVLSLSSRLFYCNFDIHLISSMQMDAHSLSVELAPVIMRQQGDPRADFYSHFYYTSKDPSGTMDQTLNHNSWVDYLGKFWYCT